MAGGWGSERLVRGTVVVPSAAYRGSGVEGGSYPFPPAGGQGCRQLVGDGGSCSSPPAGRLGQQAASQRLSDCQSYHWMLFFVSQARII